MERQVEAMVDTAPPPTGACSRHASTTGPLAGLQLVWPRPTILPGFPLPPGVRAETEHAAWAAGAATPVEATAVAERATANASLRRMAGILLLANMLTRSP